MRRLLGFLLVFLLILTGCTESGNSQTTAATSANFSAFTSTAAAAATTTATTAATTTAAPVRMLTADYDVPGSLNDANFFAAGYLGAPSDPDATAETYLAAILDGSQGYDLFDNDGENLFVIVPKYAGSKVTVYKAGCTHDGELYHDEVIGESEKTTFVLTWCETIPSTYVEVEFDGECKGFYLSLSGENGEIVLDKGILDVSAIAEPDQPHNYDLDASYLYGSWVHAGQYSDYRIEFYNETDFNFRVSPYLSDPGYTLSGTYTIDGDKITLEGYDPHGDADLIVEFDTSIDDNDGEYRLNMTYLTDIHDLFGLTSGDTLNFVLEGYDFVLQNADRAYAVMDYTIHDGDWHVEVPFIMNADTPALQWINEDFGNFRNYANEMYTDPDNESWLDWNTMIYPGEDWLQIVMLTNEYPSYGTDGNIITWNYNYYQDEDVYAENMMQEMADNMYFTEEDAMRALDSVNEYGTINWEESSLAGYLITGSATIDFYYQVLTETPGADPWYHLYTLTFDYRDCSITPKNYIAFP